MRGSGGNVLRSGLGPEDELRAGKDTLHGRLNPRVEGALTPTRVIEGHEPPHIGLGDGLAVGPAGQGRNDPGRTRRFLALARGTTHEDPRAARRIAGTARLEGPRDDERLDVRMAGPVV